MAVVVSVPLNAIFLLGTWRYSQLRLGTDSKPVTARSFDDFFEKQAREWKVPAEDAARVRSVVDMAIEDVAANANGPVEIHVGSDSFDILVTLRYRGNLPRCRTPVPRRNRSKRKALLSLTAILLACMPTASNAAPRERSVSASSFSAFETSAVNSSSEPADASRPHDPSQIVTPRKPSSFRSRSNLACVCCCFFGRGAADPAADDAGGCVPGASAKFRIVVPQHRLEVAPSPPERRSASRSLISGSSFVPALSTICHGFARAFSIQKKQYPGVAEVVGRILRVKAGRRCAARDHRRSALRAFRMECLRLREDLSMDRDG